ncbi:MAG TPA: hypothetical protein VFI30_02845 [Nocardioidaceae bacterium]|nr:hypothetical protein [Nocardioidaceae bacterium]
MSQASALAASIANEALHHSGARETATALEAADGHIEVHFSVPGAPATEWCYWEYQVRTELRLMAPYSPVLRDHPLTVVMEHDRAA